MQPPPFCPFFLLTPYYPAGGSRAMGLPPRFLPPAPQFFFFRDRLVSFFSRICVFRSGQPEGWCAGFPLFILLFAFPSIKVVVFFFSDTRRRQSPQFAFPPQAVQDSQPSFLSFPAAFPPEQPGNHRCFRSFAPWLFFSWPFFFFFNTALFLWFFAMRIAQAVLALYAVSFFFWRCVVLVFVAAG